MNDRLTEVLGFAGLGGIVAAGLLRALAPGSDALSLILAVAGLGLLIVYLFRAGPQIQRFTSLRSTREGSGVLGLTIFVIGILVMINVLSSRFSWQRDLTADALFTLAPETVSAIEQAPSDPRVTLFYPVGTPDGETALARLRPILEAARRADSGLTWEVVDPHRDPVRALKFDLRDYAGVVEVGERFETFVGTGEEDFLAALLRASRNEPTPVSFLRGHGELHPRDVTPGGLDRAVSLLRRRGHQLWLVDFLEVESLSDSTGVLVLAGPDASFTAAEEDSLLAFLDRGGRLFWMMDPGRQTRLPRVETWLGIAPTGDGFLSDPTLREPQILIPSEYGPHPVSRPLQDRGVWVVFPGVLELQVVPPRGEHRRISLMRSGRETVVAGDPASVPHSRVLAAAASRPTASGHEARAVVVGDVDWVSNTNFDSYGNGDLFLSAIQWLSEDEGRIALRPRPRTDRPVLMTRQQGRSLVVLMVGILPLAVLGAGTVVWWRRR